MEIISTLKQKIINHLGLSREKIIHETEEQTKIMLDAMRFGAMFWNKNYTIVTCNQAICRLFDLSCKQEFLDRFFEFSPEYQPCGRSSKDLAREYLDTLFSNGETLEFEWMHQKLNGEQIPCEITLVRIKHFDDYAIVGYARDLREYKQMLQKIQQRDHLLNMVNQTAVVLLSTENEENTKSVILTSMELLGMTLDIDRVHIWQNEVINMEPHFVHKFEWLSETGRQYESIPIGASIPYSKHPDWEGKFLCDECLNGPISGLTKNDQDIFKTLHIESLVIIPLFVQDRFWGFFSLDDSRRERTFSDEEISILRSSGLLIANAFIRNEMVQRIRTAAKMLETALKDAKEANASKSKFLATMSHEIRTPMNVILGITENQLEKFSHPHEIMDAFEKIYNAGDILLHIINDILDLSKIEAGKFELIPVKYEITSLINDAANLNIMRYGSKDIKFNLFADEFLPMYLYGDELRVKQIINNLLSNAFKYTDTGEISLSFTAESDNNETTTLVICVKDTGQGMTPEQVRLLFDEYSRFNLEANRTTVGTGLGMAITNNLLKMMGGTMLIDSTPKVGSVFTVRIPQGIVDSQILGKEAMEKFVNFRLTGRARKKKGKINREPMPYGKVLVVDDMPSNLDVAKLLLTPYQLQIETAESGFEAIDLIKNGKTYDIIFMDHMMPKMDGIAAAKALRDEGYKDPIVALTANAITGQQEVFLANGFDGFISKPIDMRQLNDMLNRLIRDKKHGHGQLVQTKTQDKTEAPIGLEINIPGINSNTAVTLYDEDINAYCSVLRSFVANSLVLIQELSNVSAESLKEYAVKTHGLKGISSSIGAETISNIAFDLEMAAMQGNIEKVQAGNEFLIISTKELVSNIQTWLAEQEKH